MDFPQLMLMVLTYVFMSYASITVNLGYFSSSYLSNRQGGAIFGVQLVNSAPVEGVFS